MSPPVFRKKDRIPTPASVELPPEEDLPEDSLESVLEGLPTGEEPTESMTPEEALADLLEGKSDLPEPEDYNPGHRKRQRKKELKAEPLGDTLADERAAGKRTFKEAHPRLRRFINTVLTMILILVVVLMVLSRVFASRFLEVPGETVSGVMTPIQSMFSYVSNAVTGYFRSLKYRANLESEYNALRARNEELEYENLLVKELERKVEVLSDLLAEMSANNRAGVSEMNPVLCTVIGRDEGNYFSTFTINKGSNDGIEPYMAVTLGNALIGYTETVSATRSTVRTIIDSDASIAGIIESSRDQGTVRATLGVDSTAMCRMYYLPDDNLPRPGDTVVTSGVGMSFPKGIPIGTVRESTRGMESNKQYIVLEPLADFQHLEYVIVLRYMPVAEAIQGRENGRANVDLVPLESARPSPVVPQIASSLFESQNTPDPNATPTPTPEPTETPTPTPEPTPIPTPTPEVHNIEYVPVAFNADPTPTPTPTPEPTPTPYLTPDPDDMTFEEDDA